MRCGMRISKMVLNLKNQKTGERKFLISPALLSMYLIPVTIRVFSHLDHIVGCQVGSQGQGGFPGQGDMGVGHQDDQRFVRQGHGQAGNGILVEALVAVSQRLTGSDLEAVVDKGSLTVGLTYYSINNNNK